MIEDNLPKQAIDDLPGDRLGKLLTLDVSGNALENSPVSNLFAK